MPAKTIMVIEDDESGRYLLSALLEGDGYEVLQASNGLSALESAQRHRIDAFLLDMDLPDINGIEVCRKIRAITAYNVTPVVFITGSDQTERLSGAFSAGADDFIAKPIEAPVLRARLQGHLRRMEYFNQLQRTQGMLAQYVSRRTIEIIEKASITGIAPAPEKRDVTICFTDIRGFTALSEEMDATTLFGLISARLTQQVGLVYEHGGYVDKFGGDGIMAVFDGIHGVRQSCLCAIRIIENAKADIQSAGLTPLGIGIHCGPAVIGNIGSQEHLDYSVIGTTVNLAARLCGHAEPMSIIVSKAIRDSARADHRFSFQSERQVPIRGLKQPVTVYALSSTF